MCEGFALGDNGDYASDSYATMHPVLEGRSVGDHTSAHSPLHPHSATDRQTSRIFAYPGDILPKACGPIAVTCVVLPEEKVPVDVLD